MTRTEFNALINRTDEVGTHAVGRALVHLLNRQTRDEQVTNQTRHNNNRGFTSGDGKRGSITAKFYIKHRNLMEWQLAYWRPRIAKYYRQIAEEAKKKNA